MITYYAILTNNLKCFIHFTDKMYMHASHFIFKRKVLHYIYYIIQLFFKKYIIQHMK